MSAAAGILARRSALLLFPGYETGGVDLSTGEMPGKVDGRARRGTGGCTTAALHNDWYFASTIGVSEASVSSMEFKSSTSACVYWIGRRRGGLGSEVTLDDATGVGGGGAGTRRRSSERGRRGSEGSGRGKRMALRCAEGVEGGARESTVHVLEETGRRLISEGESGMWRRRDEART